MFGMGAGSFNPSDDVPDTKDFVTSGGSFVFSIPDPILLNVISQKATTVKCRLNENSEFTSSITFGVVEVNESFESELSRVADDIKEELTLCNGQMDALNDFVSALRKQISVVARSIIQEGESLSEVLTTDSPPDSIPEENVASGEATERLNEANEDFYFLIECFRKKLSKFFGNCRSLWVAVSKLFSSLNTLVKSEIFSEKFREGIAVRFAFLSDRSFLRLMTQFGFKLEIFDAYSPKKSFFPFLVPEKNFNSKEKDIECILDSGVELCRRIMSSGLPDIVKARLLRDLKEELNDFVKRSAPLTSAFEKSFVIVVGSLTGVLQAFQGHFHGIGDN
ncbi:MAG: hypothetical protein RR456_03720 [Victivallaceae bacterium]